MEKKHKQKLSSDISQWCYDLKPETLVLFERFDTTLARSKPQPNKGDDSFDEDDDDEENDPSYGLLIEKRVPAYQTPFGIIDVPQMADANKHFKFWTMYTKIRITEKLFAALNNIDGLESLEVYSPYRARISIAPMFKDIDVRRKITKVVQQFHQPTKDKPNNNFVPKTVYDTTVLPNLEKNKRREQKNGI
jgi:hypothetical protein